MSMGRLADALGISVSSATGIVGRMEERRLVVRQGSTTDRRVVEVHLGDGATGVFEDIEQARRDHLRDVLSRVAPGDLEAFLRGLRAVRAARAQVKHERHEGSESPAQ